MMSFGALLLCGSPSLLAQPYDNPSLGQKPVAAYPQDYKPLGIRAGAFMIQPAVELAGEWTDNVFYTNENEESDFIYHLRPHVTAQSNWTRHSFNVRMAADIGRHSDFSIRDYEDYFLNVSGRIDVRTQSALNYSADYMHLHEDLNDRTAEQGVEPTKYDLAGLSLNYEHTFNRVTLRFNYNYRDLDFDDALRADGSVIDNGDRDRSIDDLGARISYAFKTDMKAFIGATWHKIDFDQEFDRNGLDRSGDGYTLNAGVSMGFTGVLTGDLFVSYHDRDYDDPTLGSFDGWAAGAGLTWYPSRLTTVKGNITSAIQETTSADASGYLGTLYQIRVDHELRRDLQVNARLSYRDNEYEVLPGAPANTRRYDDVFGGGLGATWFINRNVWLSASYDLSDLSTNVPNDDFKVNRVWLVLGLEK